MITVAEPGVPITYPGLADTVSRTVSSPSTSPRYQALRGFAVEWRTTRRVAT